MSKKVRKPVPSEVVPTIPGYESFVSEVVKLLESARRTAGRAVNAVMTATYWQIGRRIVEYEQCGRGRAEYGARLLERLSADLTSRFGRGFGVINLRQMRRFYLYWPEPRIRQTPSVELIDGPGGPQIRQTPSVELASAISATPSLGFTVADLSRAFPLPWSEYVLLLRVKNPLAREFYEIEALRGGWTVKQLNRQIATQFYERTALSRNKAAMLTKGAKAKSEDAVSPEEEIKDPFVLEFLGLKDEYSENDLEEALIGHLESFLLELGGDFTFVGRQRRLRIDDVWYRVDLVFFHRGLRCLVIVDLKLDRLTPGDVGQMHLYCNYARAHWTRPDENPPVGIILCAGPSESLARYALDGLPNPMVVREYRTLLPDEQLLADELTRTRRLLEARRRLLPRNTKPKA